MQRIALIGMLLAAFSFVHAQEKKTFMTFDSLTYAQYMAGEWRSLAETGREALRSGYDTYYLRVRVGIAYFKKKDYVKSIFQFRKALTFNATDPVALEYLYYAYQYLGREEDARALSRQFSPELLYKLRIHHPSKVQGIWADFTWSGNNSKTYQPPAELTVGGQTLPLQFSLFDVGFQHRLGKSNSLLQQYSYLSKTDFLYSYDGTEEISTERTLNEHQYTLSGLFHLARGLNLHATLHPILILLPQPSSLGNGNRSSGAPVFESLDGVASLGIYLNAWKLRFGAAASYSYLSGLYQFQQDYSLSFFPLGNLNFYTETHFIDQLEYGSPGIRYVSYAGSQLAGLKLLHNLWIEAEGMAGNLSRYNLYDGTVVYNGNERLQSRFTGRLIIPFAKYRGQFRLMYSYENSKSYFFDGKTLINSIHTVGFSSQTITGGLIWKF